MQYFIGIVPPVQYRNEIIEFQKQWGEEGMEPHITVKAQSGLTPDLEWLPLLERECLKYRSFKVTLREPMFFGEAVLFLSVISGDIYNLHKALVNTVSPSIELMKRYSELDDYVPHLTLGQTSHGLTTQQLIEMKTKAEQYLSPYPSFMVSSIRVYRQDQDGEKYQKYKDINLRD